MAHKFWYGVGAILEFQDNVYEIPVLLYDIFYFIYVAFFWPCIIFFMVFTLLNENILDISPMELSEICALYLPLCQIIVTLNDPLACRRKV